MFAIVLPKSTKPIIPLNISVKSNHISKSLSTLHKPLGIPISNKILKQCIFPVIPVRFYARKSTRTQTIEEQRTQTGTRTELETKQDQWMRGREQPKEEEGSTEDGLSSEVKAHLTKVYGTLMAGIGMASLGCFTAFLVPPLALVGMIGGFIGVLGVSFTDKSKVTLRQNMFLGTGALLGMGIGPLVAASSPGVVFAALLGTSAIFGGFSLAAYRSKKGSMLKMGGILMSCLIALVVLQLTGLILPLMGFGSPAFLSALHSISLYGGLGLFSLFVAHDTQRMIHDFEEYGERDHVGPALQMFLNVFNIFVRLLQIFRGD